jgi:hypothetical protein
MRTISIAGDEGMHDYGVLLATEEGKWIFSQLNDEGNEMISSEGFTGPLKALRILSGQGWDVVNAYSVDKKPGLNGDRFLLRKQMHKRKKKDRIGIR